MSVRYLYRVRPTEKRICDYWRCGHPILRNITMYEGHIYHHGCFMNAQDERYRCLNCGSEVSGLDIIPVNFGEGVKPQCPCGSLELERLGAFGSAKIFNL